MNYRCQGCREYHRTVYRKLGLGSVCSPECEATVRARQRGGKTATKVSDRDSHFDEPAPGLPATFSDTGDCTEPNSAPGAPGDRVHHLPAAPGDTGDPVRKVPAAPGITGDSTENAHAAPGATGDVEILSHRRQRDGIHDSTSRSSHDSKMTPREGELATRNAHGVYGHPATGTVGNRDWQHCSTPLERDRRCRYCGTIRNLDVHHIEYRSQGGNDDPHNLIVLCSRHHELVHTDKGVWQPILRAYIWLLYIENRRLFLLDIKRLYPA